MVSLQEVELLLKTQREAFNDSVNIIINSFEKRLSKVESELVQHKLELSNTKIINTDQKNTIEELKSELLSLKQNNSASHFLSTRIDYLEDQSRRNNLRFEGLPEENQENWEQTTVKVQNLIRNNLGITDTIQIERAHRTRNTNSPKPRTVVAKFLNFQDRNNILKNSRKLKGTNIFINEDLCESSNAIRREKLPELKKARSEGKVAFFSHTKLIIREKRFEGTQSRFSSNLHPEGAAALPVNTSHLATASAHARGEYSASAHKEHTAAAQRGPTAPSSKTGSRGKSESTATARNTRTSSRK